MLLHKQPALPLGWQGLLNWAHYSLCLWHFCFGEGPCHSLCIRGAPQNANKRQTPGVLNLRCCYRQPCRGYNSVFVNSLTAHSCGFRARWTDRACLKDSGCEMVISHHNPSPVPTTSSWKLSSFQMHLKTPGTFLQLQ